MPLYDFICTDCGNKLEVLVDSERKKGLEFVCLRCGGVQKASQVNNFNLLNRRQEAAAEVRPQVKSCGHAHHCRCAAIKQRKPNPFQKQIDAANLY